MASRNPTSLKELLPAVLGRLAKDGKAKGLQPVWADVVGTPLSRHVHPAELSEGTLVVVTTSKAWAREVEAQSKELCDRLSERIGRGAVSRIVCRLEQP